ncbi:fluoride efflux transporter FluC [Glaciibacter superstes]|uniref:fluoride efflux transporter FluC n=1 Tax=Glaciibacter superstes TaxID=501023 RepID=UPI0003B32065|nr:CrcB family protein [Glaciibacter superstes]
MRLVLAVFCGGMVGTALRFTIDLALPHSDAQFPVSTLLANTLGALVLGWLVGGLWTRPEVPQWLKVALGPGLLGAFTTFSGVMVSLVALSTADAVGLAWTYFGATIVLGFVAAALGLWTGGRMAHRLRRDGLPDLELPDDGLTQ